MKLPQLFDLDHPTHPKWDVPNPTADELDALFEVVVMFVGNDPRQDAPSGQVPLGSGFVVAAEDSIVIVTAAHIFTWWADQLFPPAQHALRGVQGDSEDMKLRLKQLVEGGYISVLVTPRGNRRGSILPIFAFSCGPDPRDMDIAIVQVPMPGDLTREDFRILMIDADPFPFDEPLLIAGYIGGAGGISLRDRGGEPVAFEQKLTVRAGKMGSYERDTHGFRGPMYRVNMPTLPGMSGGPLILLRTTETLAGTQTLFTAAGIVSRSRLGTPLLLDHCDDGETWVSPIVGALARKVKTVQGQLTLSEAIKRGMVPAAGSIALDIRIERDPATGLVDFKLER